MSHGRHERADKGGDDPIEQVALDTVTIAYQGHGAQFLELDIAAQRGKQVVFDGGFAAHLEAFDVADLLDGAVVLLNVPVLVMLPDKGFPVNGGKLAGIGQEHGVMAWLAFQPRPKQPHMAELLEPDNQAVVRDVQLLHLHPPAFFQGDRAVAFQREQPSQLMVLYPFQVVGATVPTVPGHPGRFESPGQHLGEHVLEIVVLGLALGFVVDPEINRQILPMDISIVKRDGVDPLDRAVMLARPEMADKRQVLAVRLVQDGIIDAQRAAVQAQVGGGLVEQVLAVIVFPLQKAGGAIVGNGHDFPQTAATPLLGFAQQEPDVHRQGATGC